MTSNMRARGRITTVRGSYKDNNTKSDWQGRKDSNFRSLGSEPSALAGLSYSPGWWLDHFGDDGGIRTHDLLTENQAA